MTKPTDLTLYTASVPNGIKVSTALEYLELPYKVYPIAFSKLEQKEPWYLEINPNGRVPAIVDVDSAGEKTCVMESGAILLYITDKYDPENKLSYPFGSKEYYEMLEWVFWQVGGLGPMQGQASHFLRYCLSDNPDVQAYGVNRYQNETRRLMTVLETRLAKQKATRNSAYLVGDHLSVADLACLGWVLFDTYVGIESSEFPLLEKWQDEISAMPLIKKGLDVPTEFRIKQVAKDPELLKQASAAGQSWIKKGGEAEKK
ncbi:glutathione S-transferase [Myxozyma melibiosi]|uniref:Glutathione S-transferase n=1 Tax=Myxozyma melibiosi TaxID=54550 RepID=A0ABR1EYH9_9ASCO